jgi:hypothetical protein
MTTSRSPIAACFVFLIFASIYLVAVVELDNTNIGTTNRLWKTPAVRGWEKGTGQKLDSGEWLYLPLYGLLCRAIPDGWVSYGVHGPVVTFRKMALFNAMFGGLASGSYSCWRCGFSRPWAHRWSRCSRTGLPRSSF